MFAIFEVGGKQYKVQQGDEIYVEKMPNDVGQSVVFDKILMVDSKVGNPYLKGAKITTKVVKHGKQKKINIIKFKSKKHHLKRMGHRQQYTKLLIETISI